MGGVYRSRPPALRRRHWSASATGALGALALHLALISAFTLGSTAGHPKRASRGELPSPNLESSATESASVLVFLDPTALASEERLPLRHPRLGPLSRKDFKTPRLVRLSEPRFGLTGYDEDGRSRGATSTTEVDGEHEALLFGRYISQISARIERAWIRPASPPGGPGFWVSEPQIAGSARVPVASARSQRFECRVQIVQSSAGQVLEVTLLTCDSSPEWQQSLVNAIDAASPLPSPPSDSVFARSLVLNFTSTVPSAGEPAPTAGSATAE